MIEPTTGKIIYGRNTKFWPDNLPNFVRDQVFNFCWNALEQPPLSEEEWKSVLERMRKMNILETDEESYNKLMQGVL
jgi:hypothetical protein